jgi:hypothetical protein
MIRRITTILAATSAFVMLVVGTATADEVVYAWNPDTDYAGSAYWTENGDTLEVCDLDADGAGVRGYIYQPNAGDHGNGTVLIKASDGNSTDGCVSVAKNISETITIAIKVCLYQGDWVGNCDWSLISR